MAGKGSARGVAVAILLAMAPAPAHALDPATPITAYIHDIWRSKDGLPQDTVQAIAQTRDGYLWLGTLEGLARFDGVRFTTFDTGNTPELRHNVVLALAAGQGGELWIGTYGGGLYRHQGGVFKRFSMADGLPSDHVRAVYLAPGGALWIGTTGGLAKIEGEELTALTTQGGLPSDRVMSIIEDHEGSLWVGTSGGGVARRRREDGVFTRFGAEHGLSSNFVWSIHEDRDHAIWISTEGGGLNRFKDGAFRVFRREDGLPSDRVMPVLADQNRNLWIGTDAGLSRLPADSAGSFATHSARTGLAKDNIRALFEDVEGSLWIGASDGGLNRLRDRRVSVLTSRGGLSASSIRTVYEGRDGSVWIGTDGGGLNRVKDGRVSVLTTRDGLGHDDVWSILEDTSGDLWVGSAGGGISRLRDGRPFAVLTTKDGLSSDAVSAIYQDRKGRIWIGSQGGGVDRFEDGRVERGALGPMLAGTLVSVLHEDRAGDLWVGTSGAGLFRWRAGSVTRFTTAEGLGSDLVLSLHEDARGGLWIATSGGGISLLKGDRIATFREKDGLYDDLAYQILEDGRGHLWMSCNRGIYRVRRSDLEDFAAGRMGAFTSQAYGTADGLSSNECNGRVQPAGTRTRDGRLWFPTMDGVVIIDPERLSSNTRPPPVLIEEVLVDKRPIASEAVVPPGRKDIEIRYTALSFAAPSRVLFKYMLVGFDSDWVQAGTRRVAYYTNIPPGDYVFRVIACNEDAVWNEEGAAFAFHLEPHIYQRPWFYGAGALLVLLAGVGVHRLRVRRLKQREAKLVRLVAARTGELQTALSSLKEKDERIGADLAEAREFQQRMLPSLPAPGAVVFAAAYRPAELVGGDIYDVCEIGPGRYRVFLADATGHGVQASLRTMVLKTEYDRLKRDERGPERVLEELNRRIAGAYPDMELLCSACCFDVNAGAEDGAVSVRYTNAGHVPLLLAREGGVEEVYLGGAFLGMVEDAGFNSVDLVINPGDRLLAFTDGLVEQESPAREAFGTDRVGAALEDRSRSLEEVVSGLLAAVEGFSGRAEWADDATLVAIERPKTGG
jgi:ligand-binding sensor domain-containing protein/serine phosphatase RsbU (regulator of sigma subunit)